MRMAFLLSLAAALLFAPGATPAQQLVIAHATLVDVADGSLHPDATIVVEGNRVVQVVHGAAATDARATVVDAHGLYVIPGLWDMHVHTYYSTSRAFGDAYVLPMLIANGITGVRDMGSRTDDVLAARDAVAAHRQVGPRMVVAGAMVDGPDASGSRAAIAVADAATGTQAVDTLADRGVDFVKVMSGIPRDAYFAIAAEAKRRNLGFEGHVPDAIRASEAVAAGQRSFEHLIGIFEASTPDEDDYLHRRYGAGTEPAANKSLASLLDGYDPAREAAMIRLLAAQHVWQCPTLYWERGQWLVDVTDYAKDLDAADVPASWRDKRYPAMQAGVFKSLDADPFPVRQRFVAHELDIVRKLHAAGVPLLAGTDAPAGVGLLPGVSLHLELQRLVAAGLTPLDALRTATLEPARFLGRTADLGGVEPGRLADLVLLRANPLEDIANTRAIAGVVADGRYWGPEELAQLRARIRNFAAAN